MFGKEMGDLLLPRLRYDKPTFAYVKAYDVINAIVWQMCLRFCFCYLLSCFISYFIQSLFQPMLQLRLAGSVIRVGEEDLERWSEQ